MRASRTVRFFSPPSPPAATAFLNRLDLHCFLTLASDRHNVQGLLASNGIGGLFCKSCKIETINRGRSCGRRCSGLVRSSDKNNSRRGNHTIVSRRKELVSYSKRLASAGRRWGWQYVGLKGWQSGSGSWLAVAAAYWIELGRPSWQEWQEWDGCPLVTQPDSHSSNLFSPAQWDQFNF